MPLSSKQRQALERWIHSKGVAQCALCGESRWRFSEAAYVRGLLEHGEPDLAEDKGVVKILCENCGHVMLFDAKRWRFEPCGIRKEVSSPYSSPASSIEVFTSDCATEKAGAPRLY